MRSARRSNAFPHKTQSSLVKHSTTLATLALLAIAATGCINVRTHSSFDPIYLNLTIDLQVKLQKELADVFGDIDAASTTINDSE